MKKHLIFLAFTDTCLTGLTLVVRTKKQEQERKKENECIVMKSVFKVNFPSQSMNEW